MTTSGKRDDVSEIGETGPYVGNRRERYNKLAEITGEVKTNEAKKQEPEKKQQETATARGKTRQGAMPATRIKQGGPSFLPDRREAPGLAMLVLASMKKSSGSWMYSVKARDLHRPRT